MFFFNKKNTGDGGQITNGLNVSQTRAVHFRNEHILVLAGAGTGKTKTIIERAKYLINSGVIPSQILLLTFTRKASSEIVERVRTELSEDQKVVGSTFHGWCNMLIFKFSSFFNLSDYTIIDRDDQESIFKLISGEIDLEFKELKIKISKCVDIYSYGRNTNKNLTESISKIIYSLPNSELTNEERLHVEKTRKILSTLVLRYQERKKERKYMDYDDLIILVGKKLNQDQGFLNMIGKTYTHVLVDEMQDTNPIQWDILDSLKTVSTLFCVGDDAQSIYSFRGADFKNIHSFKDRVANSTIMKLEDNYRSTQEILTLSNWLLENSKLSYNKKLNSVRGSGNKPIILSYDQTYELASWIVDHIEKNHKLNNDLFFENLILSRTSRASYHLQALLLEKKIPFVIFGGRGFMETAHIKDLISLMRISVNIFDEIAWIRFLTLWPGIGNAGAAKIINSILNNPSLEKSISELKSIKTQENLDEILKRAVDLKYNPTEAIDYLINRFEGMFQRKYDDFDKRKGDLIVFKELSKRYSSTLDLITSLTIDNSESASISIRNIKEDNNKNKDYVRLSTIHSAKGLEAKNVFLIDAEPGNYPSIHNLMNIENKEEDRRLLYVALTRPKDNLFICRRNYDSGTYGDCDYFLNGLPENLYEKINIRASESIISQESKISNIDMDLD